MTSSVWVWFLTIMSSDLFNQISLLWKFFSQMVHWYGIPPVCLRRGLVTYHLCTLVIDWSVVILSSIFNSLLPCSTYRLYSLIQNWKRLQNITFGATYDNGRSFRSYIPGQHDLEESILLKGVVHRHTPWSERKNQGCVYFKVLSNVYIYPCTFRD